MEDDDGQLALLIAEGSEEVELVNLEGIDHLLDIYVKDIPIITVESTTPLPSTSAACHQSPERPTVTFFVQAPKPSSTSTALQRTTQPSTSKDPPNQLLLQTSNKPPINHLPLQQYLTKFHLLLKEVYFTKSQIILQIKNLKLKERKCVSSVTSRHYDNYYNRNRSTRLYQRQ